MKVRLRLFASARELAGFSDRIVELRDGASVADVWPLLVGLHQGFADWRSSSRLAVNQQYAELAVPLHEGDEVAVIPPVSGG